MSEFGPGAGDGFYAEVVGHLVGVPHAAALLGGGSEVLGYDDARSADNAWEPRLIIFVDHDEVSLVRRAIDAGLPEAYRGHQVRFFAWQGRTVRHVEVVTVADWLEEQLGGLPDKLQPAHWLGLPASAAAAPGDGWCGVPRRRRSTV